MDRRVEKRGVRLVRLVGGAAAVALTLAACDGPPRERIPRLDDFLPPVPAATGGSRTVFAGRLDAASFPKERIAGTASEGRPGDFFMRNDRVRVVIQQPGRVIGPQPYGGNVIDADRVGIAVGSIAGNDRLGELGLVYGLGRTFDFHDPEILADGSKGGPAAIRFRGRDAVLDYINVRGLGFPGVSGARDPDLPIPFDGAVTYLLAPHEDALRILYTFFNTSDAPVVQPFGALADSGSEVELWTPGKGFFGAGFIGALSALSNAAPYGVIQGPRIAYGLCPRFVPPGTPSGLFLLGGAVLLLFGSPDILGLISATGSVVELPPRGGATFEMDLVIGRDASDIGAIEAAARGAEMGRLALDAPAGTRVFAFDAADRMVSYADAPGDLRAPPGEYVLRGAGREGLLWSTGPVAVGAGSERATLSPPAAGSLRASAFEAATGEPLPARLTVVGGTRADPRYGGTFEQTAGILAERFLGLGGELDPPVGLPRDRPVRVVISAGPEWSRLGRVLEPAGGGDRSITAPLVRVVDTSGYLACDFHQHSVQSPDAAVALEDRVRSYLAAGVEFFASSDHDYLTDYRPLIERLGAGARLAATVGVESTPFDYGHFNFYPLLPDPAIPGGGAVDWAGGADGLGLPPADLFDAYRRERGARIAQVNHPRGGAGGSFMAYFDRAALRFDYEARRFGGIRAEQPIPNQILRLPEERELFSPTFDTLEIWTGVGAADTNGDGVLEEPASDRTLRDWFSLLSFGFVATGVGNSDTHQRTRSPAGMPRTYVRVPDDGPAAIAGDPTDDVVRTLRGDGVPRDVVVTNGPFVRVRPAGSPASAIGGLLAAPDGRVALDVVVTAADWVPFDTVEIFVTQTPDPPGPGASTVLVPTLCFTARSPRAPSDPCDAAVGGARPLSVERVDLPGGAVRLRASIALAFALADLPRRPGARGDDAWLVVRARGNQALYPEIPEGVFSDANGALLAGGDEAALAAALLGVGVPAQALTNPVFVDGDADGKWRAPFAP